MRVLVAAAAAVATFALGGAACAGEVWAGAFAHDVTFLGEALGIGAAGKEDGFDIEAGARTEELGFLWRPRAYVIASANSEGDTSFAGAGLAWRFFVGPGERWYLQPGIGLVYHTGESELPDFREPGLTPEEIARRGALRQTENEYGAKVLFEPELALGVALSQRLAAEFTYTHMSNGQILGQGQNDGLDRVGARLVYRFGQ